MSRRTDAQSVAAPPRRTGDANEAQIARLEERIATLERAVERGLKPLGPRLKTLEAQLGEIADGLAMVIASQRRLEEWTAQITSAIVPEVDEV